MPPAHKNTVRFPSGALLFDQADMSRDLYVIVSGEVRVYKREGGLEVDLGTVGPGGVVGEVAAIDGGNRSASVKALTDVEAIVISESEFAGIMATIPDWFQKIARILVQRLREVDTKIDKTVDGDKTIPVAALIAMMCHSSSATLKDDGTHVINRKYLEDELMDVLSLPPPQASECLARLVNHGYIGIERGLVTIASVARLAEYGYAIFNNATDSPVV